MLLNILLCDNCKIYPQHVFIGAAIKVPIFCITGTNDFSGVLLFVSFA